MIQRNLSAWITDSAGTPLEEYKTVTTEPNTTECWIPSTEGSNFRIRWQPTRDFEPNLGLKCAIKLDGQKVSPGGLTPSQIARGAVGDKDGMTVSQGMRQYFVFCSRILTDQDDLAPPEDPRETHLGTIQITLTWVYHTNIEIPYKPGRPLEAGLVHERAVKKGHHSAAGLTAPVPCAPKLGASCLAMDASLPPAMFIFRYGPKEWLEAKGIVDASPKLEPQIIRPGLLMKKRKITPNPLSDVRSSSGASPAKRPRTYDPSEVIDVDDLESDDDLDVVVLNSSVGTEKPVTP